MNIKEFSGTVLEKGKNEVKYWLKEHHKAMSDKKITQTANEILTMFVDGDYSSLEAAVEFIMARKHI